MSRGVFRQVVDHNQSVLASIAKIFRHREAGEGSDPLQPRRTGGSGHDNDAAFGRGGAMDSFDGALDARTLLPDSDIHADNVAGFLIDDRIDPDRGLADGAIADDQFALTAAEREQGIDDEEAGLNRLDHEIPIDDGRGRALNGFQRIGYDGPLPVKRAAERIDDAAEQRRSHRHAHDIARSDHGVASFNSVRIVQQNAADAVALEHLGEAELSFLEAQK